MVDKSIELTLKAVFSVSSAVLHTVWFIVWFAYHLDVNLLTNIVSLEAIYIGLLVGIQQMRHHEFTKKQAKKRR